MRKFYCFTAAVFAFSFLLLSAKGWGQTNPAVFDLSTGSFLFTSQTVASTTYPTNIQGWNNGGTANVSSLPTVASTGDIALIANATAATNGLGNLGINGFQFASTSDASNNTVGALAIAINTTSRANITVNWTAEDRTSGSARQMNLTLQYRIGDAGSFTTVAGSTYTTSNTSQAAAQNFTNITLPTICGNQPIVHLRWIYYESASQSGSRDAVRLDDITISSFPFAYTGGGNIGGGGVNFVGSINGYSQPANCASGDYRVLNYRRVSTATGNPTDGRGQWYTTVNVQNSGGNVNPANMSGGSGSGFLFTNGGGCGSTGQYTYKWVFNGVGQAAVDGVNLTTYNGSADMGLNMSTVGRYTFVMKDVTNLNEPAFYVGYTTSNPVSIFHSATTQQTSTCFGNTIIRATLTATPSSQEKFFLRYRASTNDFSGTTNVVLGSVSGTTVTFNLPTLSTGTTYYYYILSTTHANYSNLSEADKSLAILNFADNGGTNYSFTTTSPVNVTAQATVIGNGQLTISWTNPTDCYDEILVVATDNVGGVVSVPSGDGTAYTANSLYNDGTNNAGLSTNEYAVFKGTGNSVSVTGLVNGTTYRFKIFVRKNSVWTDGMATSGIPVASFAGDFTTKQAGNWTDNNTWLKSNGAGGWIATAAGEFPNSNTSNVFISHAVNYNLSGTAYSVNNLSVTASGKLSTNTNSTNKFLTVFGNITNNGIIGNLPSSDDISFNIEGANSTISGNGTFGCSRMRKNTNNPNQTTNLVIDANFSLTWAGVQLYNNFNGAAIFNVTLNQGKTINCLNGGSISIDGTNPAGTDFYNRGGRFLFNGTVNISDRLFLTTNNTVNKCEIEIGSTGTINAASINAANSGTASHSFTIQEGGRLNITGTSAFIAFGTTNNAYSLIAGSTVEYSGGNQTVEANLPYSNLSISGTGIRTANGNLSIGKNLTLSGGSLSMVNLQANMAANATVTGSGGSLSAGTGAGTFNFAGAGTISGTTPLTFYNVQVNANTVSQSVNNTTITNLNLSGGSYSVGTNQTLNISSGGTITSIDGNLAAGTAAGLVYFSGSGSVTGGVSFYQCTIAGGVTFGTTAVINNALQINTNGFVAANPPTYAAGSTLIYNNGTGNYQRNAEWSTGASGVGVPFNVIVQNNTILYFDYNNASAADRYVRGDLTLGNSTSTGSLHMGAMTKKIVVNGNILIGGSTGTSALTLSSVFAGDLQVNGNWARNSFGTFEPSNRAVFFEGNAASVITAPSIETFHYLYINKTGSSAVQLSNDIQVNNILDFTAGNVSTGNNKVIIPQGGVVNNAGTGRGWVAGNLQKNIATANVNVVYEIGGATTYRPMTVRFSNVSTSGSLIASTSDTEHLNIDDSGIDPDKNVNPYFSLVTGTLVSAGTYTVTINYSDVDVDAVANRLNFQVSRYNGTAWLKPAVGNVTANSVQATLSDLSGTANFVIGECFRPDASNLTIAASAACSGNGATITLTSNTLNPRVYNITYTLTDANNNTTADIVAGNVSLTGSPVVSGSFQTGIINTSGNTIITIKNVELTNSLACPQTLSSSNTHTFTVTTANTWTGNASITWTESGNWSCGVVPPSGYDVIIPGSPTGGRQPQLVNNVTVGSLQWTTGATISLGANTFTINSGVSNVGTFIGSKNASLIINGGTSSIAFMQTTDTVTNALANFTVNGGSVTLAGKLAIYKLLTINTGATLNLNHQPLVLKSNYAGTAYVGPILGTLNNASNVTAERYIPQRNTRKWRLLTAPVIGTTINGSWQEGMTMNNGTHTGTPTPGYGTLITGQEMGTAANANSKGFDFWDQIANTYVSVRSYAGALTSNNAQWAVLPNTTTPGAFDQHQAYLLFVRGDRSIYGGNGVSAPVGATTLRATGTLKQGPIAFNIFGSAAQSHTLVGNPYPAPIDFYSVYQANPAKLQDRFWLFNASLGSLYGAYQLVLGDNNGKYETVPFNVSPAGSGTTDQAGRVIDAGGGFFVEPVSTSNQTINVGEAHKAVVAPAISVFRTHGQADAEQKLYVNLSDFTSGSDNLLDGVLARWDNAYAAPTGSSSPSALKPFNAGENLSIHKDGKDLMVFSASQLMASDTVRLRLWNTVANRSYRFDCKALKVGETGLIAYLVDRYLKKEVVVEPLGLISSYSFTVTSDPASKAEDRFFIVFRPAMAPLPLVVSHIQAAEQNGVVTVEWKAENESGISLCEVQKSVDGKTFDRLMQVTPRAGAGPKSYVAIDADPFATTYYRVKLVGANGQIRFSSIVKIVLQGREGITVYPSPVKGGNLHLQLINKPKGTYLITLNNMVGQKVWQQALQHKGGSTTILLALSNAVVSGAYLLEVKNKTGKTDGVKVQILQ
jgi:hypothetical protein